MKARKLHIESLEDRQMMATLYPGLSVADVTVNEGAKTVTAVISRNNTGYLTGTVDWSLKPGTAGTADYRNASGRVAFAPSETSKPITIAITDDLLAEATEEFSIVLKNPKWGKIVDGVASVKITDNDTVTPPPDPDPPTDPPPTTGDYGTKTPTGPQTISRPAGSIAVTTVSQINSAASSAVLWLANDITGTINLKSGQRLYAASGVTLRGLVTLNNASLYNLTVDASGSASAFSGSNWWKSAVMAENGSRVEGCKVIGSNGGGIGLYSGSGAYGNVTSDNRTGIKGEGTGLQIVGNLIDRNNVNDRFDPGYEAGGIKIVESQNCLIADNDVFANYGHGIWLDGLCSGITIRGNDCADNAMSGIYDEIGGGSLIEGNRAVRNGLTLFVAPDWPESAGIFLNTTHGTTIRNNVVTDNRYGIAIVHYSDRGSQYYTRDVVVSGNTLSGNVKGSGAWDVPSGSVTWDGVKLGSNFRLAR